MPHDSPKFPELTLNVHRKGGGSGFGSEFSRDKGQANNNISFMLTNSISKQKGRVYGPFYV